MNKNSPLNQTYICPIGADGVQVGGRKSYEMVLRYAHLAPVHLSDAAARIERGLGVVTDDATISLR
jgi:hypothetical protein